MRDPVAQNLIAQLVDLHETLCIRLDRDIALAAIGPADPASGFVTGTGEHDRMDGRGAAVRHAEAEQRRLVKNAQQELRRAIEWYERQLGMRPPRRARVESIDYLDGAQRRVG